MRVEFNVRAVTGARYDSFGAMASFVQDKLGSGCGDVDWSPPHDDGAPWKILASGGTDDYSANAVRARLKDVPDIEVISEQEIE